ncbi:hypothetical protein WJX81_001411 [Elliptochloris bilobata]|uniref:EF-hand domain-containing protein n=1 Tax=Elliptochloris bilobata TaxID=381761 RepID=A0AAW1S322_9CHLO
MPGSRRSLLSTSTLPADERSTGQRPAASRQVAPTAASQQELERPNLPPLSGVRTRPLRELPPLTGRPRRHGAEENAHLADGVKGTMPRARRKSNSMPSSAKAGGGGGGGGGINGAGRQRSASFMEEEEFKVDDLELDEAPAVKPWWRRFSVWISVVPALLSAVLVAAAIMMRIFNNVRIIRNFELWRWAFFVGLLFPVWTLGNLLTFMLIRSVESQFLTTRNVLYFIAAVRKPLANLLRVALIFPVYVPLFGPRAHAADGAAWIVYDNILKFLGCLLLLTFANVMGTLLAKALASHFHKEAHFDKMQRAIRNEYWLQVLATPRPGSLVAPLDDDVDDAANSALNPRFIYKHFVEPIKQAATQPFVPRPMRAASAPAPEPAPSPFEPLADALPPPPPTFREWPRTPHPPAGAFADGPPAAQACAPSQRTVAAWDAGAGAGGTAGAGLPPSATPGGYSERSAPAIQSSQSSLAQLLTGAYTQKLLHPGSGSMAGPAAGADGRKTPRAPSPPATAKAGGGAAGRMGSVAQCEGASVLSGSEAARAKAKPPELKRSGSGERTLAAQLHAVSKHLRKNPIGGATFAQALGSTAASNRAASRAGERQARRLALYIYWNVKASLDRNHIEREDLEAFLPADQAAEAFAMLDKDGNGQLTLSEVREAIVNIFRERRNLAVQLKDTKSVVGRLKLVLLLLLHIVAAFFYLLIFNVDIQKLWVFISSLIIGSAFVFGNSMKQLFESVIFLFVVHPYDVGDCLLIEGTGAGTGKFFVEEISLATTVMRRSDGTRHWYPNPKLVLLPILNLTRSDPQFCSIKVMIDLTVPVAMVEAVDAAVAACLAAAPGEFSGARVLALDERGAAGDPNKAALDISYELSHSGVDTRRTLAARSAVVQAVGDALSKAGVFYSLPPTQPYPDAPAPQDAAGDQPRK